MNIQALVLIVIIVVIVITIVVIMVVKFCGDRHCPKLGWWT